MQDRFKFRIWHKPLKQMHYNDFVITSTGYVAKIYQQDDYMMKFNQEDLEFEKQCVIMQCTGLKDKNGKLIYEGDILRINNKEIHPVEYMKCYAQFHIEDHGVVESFFCYTYEVIGNIYQNLELLTEEV